MIVELTSEEVLVAIARFAAEKAGWGWNRNVVVKGLDFESGVTADLRDGHESGVVLTRTAKLLTEDEVHYRACLDWRCKRCERIAEGRRSRGGNADGIGG